MHGGLRGGSNGEMKALRTCAPLRGHCTTLLAASASKPSTPCLHLATTSSVPFRITFPSARCKVASTPAKTLFQIRAPDV